MKCFRCHKELDIDIDAIFGVYIYPQNFSVKKKKSNVLPNPKNLKVSDGDFIKLSKQCFCDDCARSIRGFSNSLGLDKYDSGKISNLSKNGWTIKDIALDLDVPKGIVTEILRREKYEK